uniref:Uncharacterized protein n=1 Tax=Arundo donax TaxID=35708 RepID=A0A0A9HLP0_ARUDO
MQVFLSTAFLTIITPMICDICVGTC